MDEVDYRPEVILQEANYYDKALIERAGKSAEGVMCARSTPRSRRPTSFPGMQSYFDVMETVQPRRQDRRSRPAVRSSAHLLFATAANTCIDANDGVLERECVLAEGKRSRAGTGADSTPRRSPARACHRSAGSSCRSSTGGGSAGTRSSAVPTTTPAAGTAARARRRRSLVSSATTTKGVDPEIGRDSSRHVARHTDCSADNDSVKLRPQSWRAALRVSQSTARRGGRSNPHHVLNRGHMTAAGATLTSSALCRTLGRRHDVLRPDCSPVDGPNAWAGWKEDVPQSVQHPRAVHPTDSVAATMGVATDDERSKRRNHSTSDPLGDVDLHRTLALQSPRSPVEG